MTVCIPFLTAFSKPYLQEVLERAASLQASLSEALPSIFRLIQNTIVFSPVWAKTEQGNACQKMLPP